MKAKVVTSVKALFIASIFVLSILATITPQTFAVESWADKIASKIDIEYAKFIEHTLTCIGSYVCPEFLGFRATGTPQDYETASFIAKQMKEIGLVNVALEPVPVDAWEFSGAWLTINGGKTYIASSYGGVPGTDKDGITAEIVYVGKGLRPDYERLKADGISVSGKLVLAYWSPEDAWINMIGHEATIHGALGVILYNPPGGAYAQAPNALPSFDACYSSDFVPLIGISKEAAAEILELMKKGPVVGTMVSLVELYQSEGWNTIGYIPGKRSDEYIIFGAHHDAWFFGALDDTGGVAAMMTLARAIKDSGYQPERTLIFTTNTAEEYGCTDAYYDWLIGAWWRITRAHPEWQKKAVAFLNFEGMAFTGAPLEVRVVQELKSFIKRELGRNRKFLPYGWSVTEVYSWADDWPYAAAGVPTIYFAASFTSPSYPYHTQLDTVDIMDWSYLENIMKFCTRVIVDLDQAPIQPYNFETRAENLLDRLNANLMKAAGIDPKPILTEANKFLKVAREFNRVDKKRVPPELADAVQQKIREAARILLSSFTALNVWDYTIYPHEQVELDVTHLRLAIKALEMGDPTTAMRELEWWVSNNWYAPRVSYEVFKRELEHHSPEWPKLNWGGQAHLAPFIDLWQEYNSLAYKKAMGIKDFSDEIASFKSKYAESVEVYRQRIEYITNTLKDVIPLVKEATDLLK
ncbi:MAG: M28 family metallopeptidase [Candidatus Bathyarchaeia archaeon]